MSRQSVRTPESEVSQADGNSTVVARPHNGAALDLSAPHVLPVTDEWDPPSPTPITSPDRLSELQSEGKLAPDERMTVSILTKALDSLRRELEGTRAVLDEEVKTTKAVLTQQVTITSDLVTTTKAMAQDLKGNKKSLTILIILISILTIVTILSVVLRLAT